MYICIYMYIWLHYAKTKGTGTIQHALQRFDQASHQHLQDMVDHGALAVRMQSPAHVLHTAPLFGSWK